MERVIVYRNQSEAMLDQWIWGNNTGGLVEPMAIIIIAVASFCMIARMLENYRFKIPQKYSGFVRNHQTLISSILTFPVTYIGFKLFKYVIML